MPTVSAISWRFCTEIADVARHPSVSIMVLGSTPCGSSSVAAVGSGRSRRAPERLRDRFADVWPTTVKQAVASGVARFDDDGQLRLVKE